ncbi:MAG: hypothetical protein H0W86_04810 [Armatimonadetes bacterium]|nr:hypothetical protein [Armatimonadota bacterium]
MKLAIAALTAFAIFGCSKSPPADQTRAIGGLKGYAMGEPVTYENATFVPVISTKPEPDKVVDDTITLTEAKKNGWVEIIELPGQEQVNLLKVRNNGPKPLLLLSGELLLGGKQDRIIAKDTIVPAGETKDVQVFCVEHGRWDGASERFDYGGTMVPDRARKSAQYEDQEAVWEDVGRKNRSVSGTGRTSSSQSSSIRTFLDDNGLQKKLKSGVDFVSATLAQPNVVGVVFILNGEIKTFELFGTPSLFEKAHKPILESFLTEAAVAKSNKPVKALDPSKWLAFVEKYLTTPTEKREGYNTLDGDGYRGGEYNMSAGAKSAHSSFEPIK